MPVARTLDGDGMLRITALCGGVGGAKLSLGLAYADIDLSLIVNTGDDFSLYGLPICPDLDSVTYTLAGISHPEQGWGRADESSAVQNELRAFGETPWFLLGDKDIALHLVRTRLLSEGARLTEATRIIKSRLGISCALFPMADVPAPTLIESNEGPLTFQEYFVARRCAPAIRKLHFGGVDAAAAPEAVAALTNPIDGIIICPSNPFLSISPILALKEIRHALEARRAPAVAVSPLIGGSAVKGPTAKIFGELGLEANAVSAAKCYAGLIDAFIVDETDADLAPAIASLGMKPVVAPALMRSLEDRINLARCCLESIKQFRPPGRCLSREAREAFFLI